MLKVMRPYQESATVSRSSTVSIIDRIMSKVQMIPECGCWIFMGALNEAGYGIVGRGGRGEGNVRVHRFMYETFVGPIPFGLLACHRCDVRSCCNPSHLFAGTSQDNRLDCKRKGRDSPPPRNPHLRGEAHYAAKLTDEAVREIRSLIESGVSQRELGRRYGVAPTMISRIKHRSAWSHVD